MVFEEYFRKVKRDMLPMVKDWSDPQDEYRYSDNVRGMSYAEWFWLHPSAFCLVYFTYLVSAVLIFGFLVWWFALRVFPLSILFFVVWGSSAWKLFNAVRDFKSLKLTTMYDLFMREKVGGGEQ